MLNVAEQRLSGGEDPLFTLVEAIEDLSGARSVEEVAAVVRSSARRISGADGATFVLRDEDQCVYLDEDAAGPLWKGRRFPISACISGWTMLNRQAAVIPDIYQDPRIAHDAYRPTFVKSLVMTPVRPSDPLAAIGAYWNRVRQPSLDEVMKLQVIARAAAAALESVRVYAEQADTLKRGRFQLRELDHRCKNTLAAVQSIADQTLRRSASPADFVAAFNGRLGALSRAHELLTRGEWGSARLSEVLEQALGAFGQRITVCGPAMRLAPETSVALHMTFHELAVNAAKYGALTVEGGRVAVTWNVDILADPPELDLIWTERGGPPVHAAPSRGFGTRLIEQGLARQLGGEAKLNFDPEGLVFRVRAPLSERLSLA